MSKMCNVCKEEKPFSEFHKNSNNKDGLGSNCKLCHKEYCHRRHIEDPNRYKTTNAKWKKENPEKVLAMQQRAIKKRQHIKTWVAIKYEGVPCLDCFGVFPFIVMDFDHRPEEEKEFGIANFGVMSKTAINIARVEKEIAKCDLICSNCHRIRTWDRNHND